MPCGRVRVCLGAVLQEIPALHQWRAVSESPGIVLDARRC